VTFARFVEVHGPVADATPFSEERLGGRAAILPPALLRFWQDEGWGTYADGFLRMVEPAAYEPVLDDWLGLSERRATVLSSALGHLFVWAGGVAHMLDPHQGRVTKLTDDVEILFGTVLCDDDVLAGLGRDLYVEALPRLGRPTPDECFGFVPALALGGARTAENLERVQAREHLAILVSLRSD
jgi:hypothetical protein